MEVSREGVEFEVDLNLHGALPQGMGEGPTQLFEASAQLDAHVEDFRATGRFHLLATADRLLLEGPSEDHPLNLGLRLTDSSFQHRPQNIHPLIARLPASQAIQTEVGIDSAELSLENLQQLEFRRISYQGETRRRLTNLESGPITFD